MKSRKIGYTINKSRKVSTVYLKNNKKTYGNGRTVKKSQKIYKQKSNIPSKKSRKLRKTSKTCAKQWCRGYYTKKECEDKHHKFITKSKKIGSCKWKNKKCGVSMNSRKFKMGNRDDYELLNRKELQAIAKENGIRANFKSSVIIDRLLAIKSGPEQKESSNIDLTMSILDNQVLEIGGRKFVKVLFDFKNGPTGCQTFYLSTGANSKIKGLWFPTNGISTMTAASKEKYSTLWITKIAKVPWLDPKIGQVELQKIGDKIELENLLYRTDNNINMSIISCILSKTFNTFDCSNLKLPKLNFTFTFNIENIMVINTEDYRDLANWIGICNSFNWNPDHSVGRKITSAIENNGEYLSLWKDSKIPPSNPTVQNVKKYIEILERDYDSLDKIDQIKQKQKDALSLRIFFSNIKEMHSYKFK